LTSTAPVVQKHGLWRIPAGTIVAFDTGVTRNHLSATAFDPVVMWRMQRADGLSTHLVVSADRRGVSATWFLNDRPFGRRQFADLQGAMRFSESLQAQNWAVGWRLVDDDAEVDDSQWPVD
jgi:hypothetical protein